MRISNILSFNSIKCQFENIQFIVMTLEEFLSLILKQLNRIIESE